MNVSGPGQLSRFGFLVQTKDVPAKEEKKNS
jgi:hypothetical protein